MKITLLILALVSLPIIPGCIGLTYEGKYGTYTATPTGEVIIKPKYAITDAKGN